jgi:ketosteroid isomerase-like protein
VAAANVELVQRGLDAFNAGVYSGTFADDAEVWPAPGFPEVGLVKGPDETRRFFEGMRGGWKPGTSRMALRDLQAAGNRVLVSAEWRGIGEASGWPHRDRRRPTTRCRLRHSAERSGFASQTLVAPAGDHRDTHLFLDSSERGVEVGRRSRDRCAPAGSQSGPQYVTADGWRGDCFEAFQWAVEDSNLQPWD